MKKKTFALHQENGTLHSILSSLAEGVIVADPEGKFLFFNPVAEQILGIGSKNVDASEWSSLYGCFYPDEITPFPSEQLPLARALRKEKVSNELLFIKNPERPEGVYIDVSARPISDADGSIRGGTVIFRDITDSKRAEIVHKQSEERIRAQFKGIPVPTYVWQKAHNDFVLVDYNRAAEEFTPGRIKDFLGSELDKMYANSPDIKANFWRCYNEKRNIRHDMSYRFQTTGDIKDLVISYVFVPPDLVLVHTEDITERNKTVEELKMLSSAVEQTADTVLITDKNGVVVYVNPAFEETTGYRREEILGQTPGKLKSGQHDKAFYKKLWSLLLSGTPFRGTITNKKKSGEIYWCEQTITPMKNEKGEFTHFVSVMKDITELKKNQEHEFHLSIAREVQQRLYRTSISVPGFDIAGASYPAVETGGDFFDFISMSDGTIGMVVGDASGHGIGPALIMQATRAYLRAFAKMESDPAAILTRLNQELVADLDETNFVTLILVRLDPNQCVMDYASAGHVSGYVLNDHGDVAYELVSTGIPLGVFADVQFEKSDPIKLPEKSLVALVSDGVSEAQSPDEIDFRDDGALEVIAKNRQAKASDIVNHLYQAVLSFSSHRTPEDDITGIICKVE